VGLLQHLFLKKSGDRLRFCVEHLPTIMWIASGDDGSVTYLNNQWLLYTGLGREASKKWGWIKACPPEDQNKIIAELKRAFYHGISFQKEMRIKNVACGSYRWVELRANPMHDRMGRIIQWTGVMVDIHEQKEEEEKIGELQKKLIFSTEEAEKANLAKTAFLATMSHEIRTPLGAILGFSEILQRTDQTPQERTKAIDIVKRNGEHLSHLVDEILDLSKIEVGHLEVEKLQFDLHDALDYVRDLMQFKAQEKGIELKFIFSDRLPPQIVTDPTRLRQILINLIGNAIKFTINGSVEVRVDYVPAFVEKNHSLIRFTITDTGIGIPKEQQKLLFQPFVQADSSMSRKFGGTGLGLALSRKLAQALGGDAVLVESNVDKGSTFLIEVDAGETAKNAVERNGVRTQEIMTAQRQPARDLKILVADDTFDNQILIRSMLKSTGAEVVMVDDGVKALSVALSRDFDIILMDIQMPKMNGYEAVQKLRSGGYKKPVVALTAHARKEDRELAFRAGFDDYLTKPINRHTLHGIIAHYAAKIDKTGDPFSHPSLQ
jgi:PAS domain S-box-containing protein